jgi:hypothetical protein
MAEDPATVLASDKPGKYCSEECCPGAAAAPPTHYVANDGSCASCGGYVESCSVPKASGAASAAPLLAAGLTVLLATLA